MMSNSEAAKAREEVIKDLLYCQSLRNQGWTSVDYPRGYTGWRDIADIKLWVTDNLGECHNMGRTYFFKDAKDATMFLLRWA